MDVGFPVHALPNKVHVAPIFKQQGSYLPKHTGPKHLTHASERSSNNQIHILSSQGCLCSGLPYPQGLVKWKLKQQDSQCIRVTMYNTEGEIPNLWYIGSGLLLCGLAG